MAEVVADLHLHSYYSDGLNAPSDLCRQLADKGVRAFSLTDHDSVQGHAECRKCEGLEFIPGIEITSTLNGKEIHILGYFIDSDNALLNKTLENIAERRKERLKSIVEKLNRNSGLNLAWETVEGNIGHGSYNRLNLARLIMAEGKANTLDQVFRRYLGDETDAYEAVDYFSPADAIRLIHHAGGLAFLAHPYISGVADLTPMLVKEGLDGIEAYHPSHSVGDQRAALRLAKKYGLAVSGGSDYHGNEGSSRQILSAGLNGDELENFLAAAPAGHAVTSLGGVNEA